MSERERERQTDREIDRETDRETDRQTDRQTELAAGRCPLSTRDTDRPSTCLVTGFLFVDLDVATLLRLLSWRRDINNICNEQSTAERQPSQKVLKKLEAGKKGETTYRR